MREILFRGKRTDNGEWVEGSYLKWYFLPGMNDWIVPLSGASSRLIECIEHHNVVPATLGQYTGLQDKNGNRIFEGDIVRGRDALEKGLVVEGYIDHQYGSFCIVGDLMTHFRWLDYEVEVIGNIHDNPELIGGKEDD